VMVTVGMERRVKVVPLGRAAQVMGGVALPMITACLQMGVRLPLGAALRLVRDVKLAD
jgi:hypothetical protein